MPSDLSWRDAAAETTTRRDEPPESKEVAGETTSGGTESSAGEGFDDLNGSTSTNAGALDASPKSEDNWLAGDIAGTSYKPASDQSNDTPAQAPAEVAASSDDWLGGNEPGAKLVPTGTDTTVVNEHGGPTHTADGPVVGSSSSAGTEIAAREAPPANQAVESPSIAQPETATPAPVSDGGGALTLPPQDAVAVASALASNGPEAVQVIQRAANPESQVQDILVKAGATGAAGDQALRSGLVETFLPSSVLGPVRTDTEANMQADLAANSLAIQGAEAAAAQNTAANISAEEARVTAEKAIEEASRVNEIVEQQRLANQQLAAEPPVFDNPPSGNPHNDSPSFQTVAEAVTQPKIDEEALSNWNARREIFQENADILAEKMLPHAAKHSTEWGVSDEEFAKMTSDTIRNPDIYKRVGQKDVFFDSQKDNIVVLNEKDDIYGGSSFKGDVKRFNRFN
jgi:hypothetical protein